MLCCFVLGAVLSSWNTRGPHGTKNVRHRHVAVYERVGASSHEQLTFGLAFDHLLFLAQLLPCLLQSHVEHAQEGWKPVLTYTRISYWGKAVQTYLLYALGSHVLQVCLLKVCVHEAKRMLTQQAAARPPIRDSVQPSSEL
jgi:hypothetical protein